MYQSLLLFLIFSNHNFIYINAAKVFKLARLTVSQQRILHPKSVNILLYGRTSSSVTRFWLLTVTRQCRHTYMALYTANRRRRRLHNHFDHYNIM